MNDETTCIVCGTPCARSSIVVGDAAIGLCPAHAARLDPKAPAVFETFAAFFEGSGLERRIEVDRRRMDRRMFPPRPELRRKNNGRRKDDPRF
jgi:hypothetical protein